MAQRVMGLRTTYFWLRESRRSNKVSAKATILTPRGPVETLEPTLLLAELMTEGLQKLSDDSDDWRALSKGGIVDMYFEIVTDPGFFTEHVILVDVLLLGFNSAVENCSRDVTLSNNVLSRARDLWKSIWDSREYIRAWPRSKRLPAFQAAGKFTEPLAYLLGLFHALYWQRHSFSPPFDTYMPHVGLLLWERTKGRQDLSSSATLSLNTLNILNSERTPEFITAYETFSKDAIVNGIGLEAFRLRFEQDTRRLSNTRDEDIEEEDYAHWALLHQPLRTMDVMIYLMHHDTLGICVELCNALSRELRLHLGVYGMVFETVYQLFSLYAGHWYGHLDQDIVLRGDTAVDILAIAIAFTARAGNGTKVGSARMNEAFLLRICDDLYYLTSFITVAPDASPSPKAKFIAECRAHAPSQWHQSLTLLTTAMQRGELNKDTHHRMLQYWVDFGRALGLKEDKERVRLARLTRTRSRTQWLRTECTLPV
ncbi:unnamed protein product [Peniophora sp. CBMAI 1063]|nr:unnamed protein product [Peniophora sp. CBMAI 1063]